MKTTMRSDKRKNPQQVEYEFLTFAECKSLHGHACILDRQGKIANVKITSVKTWKTRPDELEVHCKFGLYEYFVVTVTAERPNTELVRIAETQEEKTVTLPDGYNGDSVDCYLTPIKTDGELIQLKVKDSYLTRWTTQEEINENLK